MTTMHRLPLSSPMDMPGNGMHFPAYLDADQSHYASTMMSPEGQLDSATIDPKNTFTNFDDMDFPVFDSNFDQLVATPNELSMLSPAITSTQIDADPYADMETILHNAHAAPWNPTIPRSDPTMNRHSLQIPGQPKHQFMSLPNGFGAQSFDSAYVSQVHAPDTTSFVSAPSAAMYSCNDDESDIIERPTKKVKKLFHCDLPGEHRTRDFANIHDLERHQRSTHGIKPKHSQCHYYQCILKDCRNKTKTWDRKDNFRSHIVRKHYGGRVSESQSQKKAIDDLVQRSQLALEQEDIDRIFAQKQEAKAVSRQSASKRRARKSSSRLDAESAHRVRGSMAATSDAASASAVASAADESEYPACAEDNHTLSHDTDASNGLTPIAHASHMAAYAFGNGLRPEMPCGDSSSSGGFDLW